MNRVRLALAVGLAAFIAGLFLISAPSSASADCCSIPSGETFQPSHGPTLPAATTSAPVYGFPGETFRPCIPRLGHPC